MAHQINNDRADRILTVVTLVVVLVAIAAIGAVALGAAQVADDTGTQIGTSETVTVNNSSETVVVDLSSDDTLSEDTELTAYAYDSADSEVANATTHINSTDANATVELDVADDTTDLEGNESWTVDVYGSGSTDAISVAAVDVEHSGGGFPIFGDSQTGATALGVVVLVGGGFVLYRRD